MEQLGPLVGNKTGKERQPPMGNDTTQQLLTEVEAKDDSQSTVTIAEDVQHETKDS